MKIKEVIAQTGLTDRAIRLYIENGLISPETEKSYTGRRSFDFSDADVAMLGKIATLRKADFSLEQIKALQQGGEEAQSALAQYLEYKQETVATGQRILAVLTDLPPAAGMEDICTRLEDGLRDKPLPKADTRPTGWELVETGLALFCITIMVPWIPLALIALAEQFQEYTCIHWSQDPMEYVGIGYVLISLVLFAVVLFLRRKPQPDPKKQRKRTLASILISTALLLSILSPHGIVGLLFGRPVYSESYDPLAYGNWGKAAEAFPDLVAFLPEAIPENTKAAPQYGFGPEVYPETTQYYFYFAYDWDPRVDVYAQWELPPDQVEAELQRVQEAFFWPVEQLQLGSWQVYSSSFHPLEDIPGGNYYSYMIFAYNPETQLVRYIFSDGAISDGHQPVFLRLDWD